jgi:sigma-B regulation protein RsbU (phosphoserine phosphatase)
MMFVTVLLCMMELSTGNIEFANAGHNPPLLMKNNNQDVDYLHLNKSKILGVFPDAPYTNQNITLNPQDTLVLYTDGVTEAMDPDNNQFTENKLHETLLNLQGFSVEKIEEGIQHAVKGFVKDAEQSDDITLLIVQYYGK